MRQRDWSKTRFDSNEEDPVGSLTNLVDIMLVFVCGLVVALMASGGLKDHAAGRQSGVAVEKGRELPPTPAGDLAGGSGMAPVGQVYRDPKSGKLILVEEPARASR